MKSPEDTVVRKLLWFRRGGEVASQQWRDIVEVLRVSGPSLDFGYVARWAQSLEVADLLLKARAEAERAR